MNKRPGAYEVLKSSPWWKSLKEKVDANAVSTQAQIDEESPPMNYYNAFHEVCTHLLAIKGLLAKRLQFQISVILKLE